LAIRKSFGEGWRREAIASVVEMRDDWIIQMIGAVQPFESDRSGMEGAYFVGALVRIG
jgi:hypothetical protein